jgi:hypothetical protein
MKHFAMDSLTSLEVNDLPASSLRLPAADGESWTVSARTATLF